MAMGVVGGGVGVVGAVDRECRRQRTRERVVGIGAVVARRRGSARDEADPVCRRVVGPVAGEIGFGPLSRALQLVVGQRRELAARIGLALELAKHVVGVGPGAKIGVGRR